MTKKKRPRVLMEAEKLAQANEMAAISDRLNRLLQTDPAPLGAPIRKELNLPEPDEAEEVAA